MVRVPDVTRTTADAIYDALEAGAVDGPRTHLGASQIGKSCSRQLWYQFRWAMPREQHPGRILRLFRRGHQEEENLTRDLRAAGIEVIDVDNTGEQFRFEAVGGHFGGSMDGIGRGFPECSNPDKWHVLEYKTHNQASFNKLKKEGVEKAKPEHYVQMQMYMGMSGDTNETRMTRAMYIAVHKDTDNIYVERIKYVHDVYKKHLDRARAIILDDEPPPPVSTDPTWYECKWCPAAGICHGKEMPSVNCRTCAHVTADELGGWSCMLKGEELIPPAQWEGCDDHVYNTYLIDGRIAQRGEGSSNENWVQYTMPDGRTFKNGTKAPDIYASSELRDIDIAMIGDKTFEAMRAQFGGHVLPVPDAQPGLPFDDEIPF